MRFLATVVLVVTFVGAAGSFCAEAAEPTAQEQYMIYELNRARSNPTDWAQEYQLLDYSNQSNPVPLDLSYVTPQPPLAVNEALISSARFHAEEMATYNYFSHQSQVTGDYPNKMARDAGYPLKSSFSDSANSIESNAAGYGSGGQDYSHAINALADLIEDKSYALYPGHRNHLLGIGGWASFTEVGAGYGYNSNALLRNYWSIHTGQQDMVKTFLTGVVYNDGNGNLRYDINEGLGGVTVSAGVLKTTSNTQGGWALEVTDGLHVVSCSGPGFAGTASIHIRVNGRNREVDCVSGESAPIVDFGLIPPENVTLIDAILALQAITNNLVDLASYQAGDINGDGRIGLAEAIYVLQVLGKIRN